MSKKIWITTEELLRTPIVDTKVYIFKQIKCKTWKDVATRHIINNIEYRCIIKYIANLQSVGHIYT